MNNGKLLDIIIQHTANSKTFDATNSTTSKIQKEERRVIRVIISAYTFSGDGRRSEDDGSNNDEKEVKQYEYIDEETRAAYIGLLYFKRTNEYPDLRFVDLV